MRWLVYLWTAQNVFLVASSAKRTLSYIDAYGMTLWRLSGLIWMGLVAAGLIFIAARVITRRSNSWLINVNLGTGFAVLLTCGLIDFRAIVADWNVSRALQQISPTSTLQTLDLDISYLRELGPSAIPALAHLIAAMPADGSIWTTAGELSSTARQLKGSLDARLKWTQMDWKTWTFRNRWTDFGGTGT